jgi:hypothetical protein
VRDGREPPGSDRSPPSHARKDEKSPASPNSDGLTGIVNAWILVGSFKALTATEYGHLLMGKTALFAAMLMIAAVNRLRLTPRLCSLDRKRAVA